MAALVGLTREMAIDSLSIEGKKKILSALDIKKVKGKKKEEINNLIDDNADRITKNIMLKADSLLLGDDKQYKGRHFLKQDSSIWSEYINDYIIGLDFAGQELFSPQKHATADYGQDTSVSPGITSPVIKEGLRRQMDAQEFPNDDDLTLSKRFNSEELPKNDEAINFGDMDGFIGDLNFFSDVSDDDVKDDDVKLEFSDDDVKSEFSDDEKMKDGYDSTDDMQGFGDLIGSPSGKLCPACISGLCDTHIQLRF